MEETFIDLDNKKPISLNLGDYELGEIIGTGKILFLKIIDFKIIFGDC